MSGSRPSTGIQFFVVLLCLFGGPIAALYLVLWTTPGADLTHAIVPMLAGATFFFGFFAWLGGAFLSLLTRSGRKQARSGRPPKGSTGFVVVAVLTGGAAAGLAAFSGPGFLGPLWKVFGYFLAYGYLLHRLARAGYLPFVED